MLFKEKERKLMEKVTSKYNGQNGYSWVPNKRTAQNKRIGGKIKL